MKLASSVIDLEVRRLEAESRRHLSDLKILLESDPEKARRVVNSLIAGGDVRAGQDPRGHAVPNFGPHVRGSIDQY